MKKTKVFFTLTGYQLTWLACVFGEVKFNLPNLGVYFGIIYLSLYIYLSNNKYNFFRIILLIAIPGYLFDTLIVYFEIYEFKTSYFFGILPIWMTVLWLSFATLFDEILIFFKKYKTIGIVSSSILGPLTYYLGVPINAISINNVYLFFLLMIIFWFSLMLFYLNIVLRNTNLR